MNTGHLFIIFGFFNFFQQCLVVFSVEVFTSFSSVQFSHSVVSDSLWPHELQHSRPPCPPPTPRVHPNSCPSSWWCHPAISSFVVPFSSCPQSFPASKSFPMSRLFTSCGQSSGALASVSVLPVTTQDWFPLRLTGLIFLHSKGLSRVFSSGTVQKDQFFSTQPSVWSNSHIHTWLLENHSFDEMGWIPRSYIGASPVTGGP